MADYPPPDRITPIFNSSVYGSETTNNYVDLTTAQTISGAKTFNNSCIKIKDTTGGGTATLGYTSANDNTSYNFLSTTTGGTQFIVSDLVSMQLYNKNLSDATNSFPRFYYIVYGNGSNQAIVGGSNVDLTSTLWAGTTDNSASGQITYSGGVYTVTNAGLYLVNASATFASNASTARRFFRIQCSDGQVNDQTYSLGGASILMSNTGFFSLAAGTTVKMVASQDAVAGPGTLNINASASQKFAIYKIL